MNVLGKACNWETEQRLQCDCALQNQEGMLLDSSDTHSVSSTSFISAVSSQEDITLENLHMQINKPITDSPLLMSSYVNHLSQVYAYNWPHDHRATG